MAALPVPLPVNYVSGIDVQRRDFEGGMRPSFLAGEWRQGGWWYYYLYALAVKVPLGTLALVLWSLFLVLLRRPAGTRLLDDLMLWLPGIAVLALVSSQTGFNHHMRYVLPMFPFLLIAASKLTYYLQEVYKKTCVVVVVLLCWSVTGSLSVYPHSLSYFNAIAGGPDNGHRCLLASNVDWGQDLLYLKDWVDAHPEATPIGLAYHHFIDYQICSEKFEHMPADLPPGISSNKRGSMEFGPHPGDFAADLYSLKMGSYKHLDRFQPIAKAGYSIFIYHITFEQANQARREMGLIPLPATLAP